MNPHEINNYFYYTTRYMICHGKILLNVTVSHIYRFLFLLYNEQVFDKFHFRSIIFIYDKAKQTLSPSGSAESCVRVQYFLHLFL